MHKLQIFVTILFSGQTNRAWADRSFPGGKLRHEVELMSVLASLASKRLSGLKLVASLLDGKIGKRRRNNLGSDGIREAPVCIGGILLGSKS
jgi:hypothetical protein